MSWWCNSLRPKISKIPYIRRYSYVGYYNKKWTYIEQPTKNPNLVGNLSWNTNKGSRNIHTYCDQLNWKSGGNVIRGTMTKCWHILYIFEEEFNYPKRARNVILQEIWLKIGVEILNIWKVRRYSYTWFKTAHWETEM